MSGYRRPGLCCYFDKIGGHIYRMCIIQALGSYGNSEVIGDVDYVAFVTQSTQIDKCSSRH